MGVKDGVYFCDRCGRSLAVTDGRSTSGRLLCLRCRARRTRMVLLTVVGLAVLIGITAGAASLALDHGEAAHSQTSELASTLVRYTASPMHDQNRSYPKLTPITDAAEQIGLLRRHSWRDGSAHTYLTVVVDRAGRPSTVELSHRWQGDSLEDHDRAILRVFRDLTASVIGETAALDVVRSLGACQSYVSTREHPYIHDGPLRKVQLPAAWGLLARVDRSSWSGSGGPGTALTSWRILIWQRTPDADRRLTFSDWDSFNASCRRWRNSPPARRD